MAVVEEWPAEKTFIRHSERNPIKLNPRTSLVFCLAHDLVREPVPTFRDHALIPLKYRFLFGDKGAIGALEILGLHADRLRLRFGLDELIETHRPFLNELRLGDAVGESRARRNPPRQRQGLVFERLGVDKFVEEAPLLSFLRA